MHVTLYIRIGERGLLIQERWHRESSHFIFPSSHVSLSNEIHHPWNSNLNFNGCVNSNHAQCTVCTLSLLSPNVLTAGLALSRATIACRRIKKNSRERDFLPWARRICKFDQKRLFVMRKREKAEEKEEQVSVCACGSVYCKFKTRLLNIPNTS